MKAGQKSRCQWSGVGPEDFWWGRRRARRTGKVGEARRISKWKRRRAGKRETGMLLPGKLVSCEENAALASRLELALKQLLLRVSISSSSHLCLASLGCHVPDFDQVLGLLGILHSSST